MFNCILTDDYTKLVALGQNQNPEAGQLFNTLALVSSVSLFISTLTQLCIIAIGGPIAVIIIGTVKEVALTCISYIYFADLEITPVLGAGLAISLVGTGLWVKSKYKESFQAK